MGGRGIYCAPFYQGNCLFHMGMVLGGGGGVFGGLYFSEGIVFLGISYPCPDLL